VVELDFKNINYILEVDAGKEIKGGGCVTQQ
jgi:hypothetical protein